MQLFIEASLETDIAQVEENGTQFYAGTTRDNATNRSAGVYDVKEMCRLRRTSRTKWLSNHSP